MKEIMGQEFLREAISVHLEEMSFKKIDGIDGEYYEGKIVGRTPNMDKIITVNIPIMSKIDLGITLGSYDMGYAINRYIKNIKLEIDAQVLASYQQDKKDDEYLTITVKKVPKLTLAEIEELLGYDFIFDDGSESGED